MLLSLLIVGCQRPTAKIVSIDPAFQKYVDDFVADSRTVGSDIVIDNLIMQFTTQQTAETLGECQYYVDDSGNVLGTPTIQIDAQDWPTESDTYRKIVIYHELGHCVLFRKHVFTGNILNNYCSSTSIMFPYIQNTTNMYTENWSWYVEEMFHWNIIDSPTTLLLNQQCNFDNDWFGL
jgi:hypothetical protein